MRDVGWEGWVIDPQRADGGTQNQGGCPSPFPCGRGTVGRGPASEVTLVGLVDLGEQQLVVSTAGEQPGTVEQHRCGS